LQAFFDSELSDFKETLEKSPSGWKVGFWWLFLFMQRSLKV